MSHIKLKDGWTVEGGLLWVCIISNICLWLRLVCLQKFPFTLVHFTLTPDNTHNERNAQLSHVQWLIQSQRSTLINKLQILHIRAAEKWAQCDWIAASVSLIWPEELWVQVLINGTGNASPLIWRRSFACTKHQAFTAAVTAIQQIHIRTTYILITSCRIQQIGQNSVRVQQNDVRYKHVLHKWKCIFLTVCSRQHASPFIFQIYTLELHAGIR